MRILNHHILTLLFLLMSFSILNANSNKKIAYIVSDTTIPYWDIMSRGIKNSAKSLGYGVEIYNSFNDPKTELENTIKVINENVSAIIVSPNNSSSCSTILKLSKKANKVLWSSLSCKFIKLKNWIELMQINYYN